MAQPTPGEIVAHVLAGSRMAQGLGLRLLETGPGFVQLAMRVTPVLLNGQGTCHGGHLFSLGDCAGAFACLTRNRRAVTHSAQIAYLEPALVDQDLVAEARELGRRKRTGTYSVRIMHNGRVIATMTAICAIREEPVLPLAAERLFSTPSAATGGAAGIRPSIAHDGWLRAP